MEELVEEEARKVPILKDISDHKVLGREYKRGKEEGKQEGKAEGKLEGKAEGKLEGKLEGKQQGAHEEALAILRRLLEKRFGPLPTGAMDRLSSQTVPELEELTLRLLDARNLADLLS